MKNPVFPIFFLKRALVAALALQMGPALSSAQAQTAPASAEIVARVQLDESNQKVLLQDGDNQTLMEIPYSKAQDLRASSPSRLALNLGNEMAKIKSASGAAWSHSTRHLLPESGVFFLSMGAVVASQVLFNYAQNPIALQEYLDHQLSPVGSASFFAFMYSQGVTANVLSLYMRQPRLQTLIPYLGMSVGAFVQSGLSQFASDPDVKDCALSWTPKGNTVDPQACDRAYERYAVGRQIWQAAPGIASMLTSSLIASTGQNFLRKAGQGLARKAALRVVGFELAAWLAPGGMEVKGMRLFLTKGLQIGAFVAIDSWLSGKINFIWKNVFDGREFDRMDAQIVQEKDPKKRAALLKAFHERATEWRALNLADVYQAHQAWSENLQRLTGMYNASYQFYNAFLNEVRSAANNPLAPLNKTSPLNGIVAKGLAKEDADMYLTDPVFVETMQLATVQDAVKVLDQKFANDEFTQEGVSSLTQNRLRELRNQLATGDKEKIGLALNDARKAIYDVNTGLQESELRLELYKVLQLMGSPAPALEPGRGFVDAYQVAPTTSAALKDVPFYRRVGVMKTETITDYLLASMVCGPDVEKNEKAVFTTAGFPGIFTPPQIGDAGTVSPSICQSVSAEGLFTPYRTQIAGSASAIDFLKKHARASVLGPQEESRFQTWWEKNTETQMKKVFDFYAQSYLQIVGDLVSGIFRNDQSRVNTGSMANGTVLSLIQEAHVYEGQLNELLNTGFVPAGPVMTVHDFASGRGANATPSAQQQQYETRLKELIDLLKRISVEKNEQGRTVLKTDLQPDEIGRKKTEVEKALEQWKTFTKSRGLNDDQMTLAQSCFDGLRAISDELGLYGQIARAVSTWEETKNKPVSEEEKSLRDKILGQVRKLKNSLLPIKN